MAQSFLKLVNKKIILPLVFSSTFITGCTFIVIWLYLFNIERLDILYAALSMSSAMGIIFGFTLVSLIGFSIIVFPSSFMLYIIYNANEKNFKKYDGLSHSLAVLSCLNSYVFLVTIIGTFCLKYYLKWEGYIVVFIFMFIVIASSYFLTRKVIFKSEGYLKRDNELEDKPLQKNSFRISLPLLLIIPALMQIFPVLLLTKQMDFAEGTNEILQIIFFCGFAFLIITLGIFPGMVLVNEKKNKDAIKLISYWFIGVVVALLFLSFFFRSIPNIILNMTMNLSGISDGRVHQYYIDTKKYPEAMFNKSIWNARSYDNIPERFFISGMTLFSLGEIKLVCPVEVIDVRKNSLKIYPNDFDKYDERIKFLKDSAMKCIPFNKEDIHVWDSPLSEYFD